MDHQELMKKAQTAAANAYIPYSKFAVGACVLTENGKIYTGCNFENASFGLTICAERNAIGAMIADGERAIRAITIYSPNMKNCTPCGACRQVIHEFRSFGGTIIITEADDGFNTYKIEELLPEGFVL